MSSRFRIESNKAIPTIISYFDNLAKNKDVPDSAYGMPLIYAISEHLEPKTKQSLFHDILGAKNKMLAPLPPTPEHHLNLLAKNSTGA